MKTWTRAGVMVVLVLVVHVWAVSTDAYYTSIWLDILMHFAGGIAVGALALAIWDQLIQSINFSPKTPGWLRPLTQLMGILGLVALVGIAWEWYELIFDTYVHRFNLGYQPTQPGLPDTMADLVFDLLGGTFAWLVLRSRS